MLYSGTPFFMIPEAALESDTFFDLFASSAKGMLLLILMRDAARSYNHWSPKCVAALKQQGRVCAEYSYDALAAKCRVSRRTIITWTNDLEARGLIRKLPQGDHDRNLFQVGQRPYETAPVLYFANDLFIQEAAAQGELDHANDTVTVVLPPASDPQITPGGSDPEITPLGDPQITPPGDLEITQDTDGSHAQTGSTRDGSAPLARGPAAPREKTQAAKKPAAIPLAGSAPTHEDRLARRGGKPGRSSDQRGAGGLLGHADTLANGAAKPKSLPARSRRVIDYFVKQMMEVHGDAYSPTQTDEATVDGIMARLGDNVEWDRLFRMLDFMIANSYEVRNYTDAPQLFRIFHDKWFNSLYSAAGKGKLDSLLVKKTESTATPEIKKELDDHFNKITW